MTLLFAPCCVAHFSEQLHRSCSRRGRPAIIHLLPQMRSARASETLRRLLLCSETFRPRWRHVSVCLPGVLPSRRLRHRPTCLLSSANEAVWPVISLRWQSSLESLSCDHLDADEESNEDMPAPIASMRPSRASKQTPAAPSNLFGTMSKDTVSDGLSKQQPEPSNVSLVEVADLAQQIRSQVREYIASLNKQRPESIRIVGVLAQQRMDSAVYSKTIAKACQHDGIIYEEIRCTSEHGAVTPQDIDAVIQELNQRDDVHGILVFYPIFKRLDNPRASPKGPYLNAANGVSGASQHASFLNSLLIFMCDHAGTLQNT
jgi:Tetrahydrofolate dehydrogenase/cyclohydrolase, catalytic domain